MKFTVEQIASLLDGEVVGNEKASINQLGKIQESNEGMLSFLANPKYEEYIYTSNASAVIVSKDFIPKNGLKTTLIKVDDPYACFTILLDEYHKQITYQHSGIEEPSFIGKSTTVGEDIYRGAFSYIGKNCKIGNNVKIHPSAHIGDNCVIGDNCLLFPGAKLYPGVLLGNNCVIHAGAVIGSDGFGFAPQKDGSFKPIPQMGNVVLEDNVSIGSNTVIDCATFDKDSTIIKEGTKIDNLVQVAHNVTIGKNTVIAAQAGVAGSTEIGDQCMLGGQSAIAGHLKVANNTTLGAKTGISKTIKKEGQVLFGVLGFEIKSFMKSYSIFKMLPDLMHQVQELRKKG